MRASVQAAVAYKRKLLIDAVTSDEDKVAPVYRLEELCQVLKNSPPDVVREMLERILERLNHKSPIVKQKTLRLIKSAAGKGGTDFRREMQRQAGAVKALFTYKGQLDALKGDALNKAVRDSAHEAVSAIFGTEEKRTTTMEDVGRRIQGFGNANYEIRPKADDKKSVFSELVGFGSQSLKQSIEIFQSYNQYPGSGSGSNGSSISETYRAQGLRRSLTAERDKPFEREEGLAWSVRDAATDDERANSLRADSSVILDSNNSRGSSAHRSAEDRLLDSLTVPGGVRLQPSREALQTFTSVAQKFEAPGLVQSLEAKLQVHSWQVRFKTLCLIETLLKARAENAVLDAVAEMFEEDAKLIVDCLQSPQTSLREKAKKVLDLLGGSQQVSKLEGGAAAGQSKGIADAAVPDLPDLLDTRDMEFNLEEDLLGSSMNLQDDRKSDHTMLPATSGRVEDLLGNWTGETAQNTELDPFAGMSVHSFDGGGEKGKQADFLLSGEGKNGMTAGDGALRESSGANNNSSFPGLSSTLNSFATNSGDRLLDLMGGLSTTGASSSDTTTVNLNSSILNAPQRSLSAAAPSTEQSNPLQVLNSTGKSITAGPQPLHHQSGSLLPEVFPNASNGSQMLFYNTGRSQNPSRMRPGISTAFSANAMGQPFAGQHVEFNGAYNAFRQHQPTVHTLSDRNGPFQNSVLSGGLTDDFDFSGNPKYVPNPDTKEDTKAFDFISEHISSQLALK